MSETQDIKWLFSRVGKITASNFKNVTGKKIASDFKVELKEFDSAVYKPNKNQQIILDFIQSTKDCLKSHLMQELKLNTDSPLLTMGRKGCLKLVPIYKNELSTGATSQMLSMLGELAKGEPFEFNNKATDHGTETEPQARELFEFTHGLKVKETGLCLLSERLKGVKYANIIGASVDGLIGEEETLEIKCPYNYIQHLRTVYTKQVPFEHMEQIQGQLWVTGRKRCYFVSYYDFPQKSSHLSLFVKIVERDEKKIEYIADNVFKFAEIFSKQRDKMRLPKELVY